MNNGDAGDLRRHKGVVIRNFDGFVKFDKLLNNQWSCRWFALTSNYISLQYIIVHQIENNNWKQHAFFLL